MASTFIQLPLENSGGGSGVTSFNGRVGTVVATSGDYVASQITNIPAGNITSTQVQNALNELDSIKQATITGAATSIANSNLAINLALISNASGKVAVSSTTSTELGYVSGVTSSIQTQLNSKLVAANNLSDVASASTSRTNLGLGTAATKDIPAVGDASSTQVVFGTDSRLTNSRTPIGSAGGDLSGTYPNPTLTTTGVTANSYGSATQVPTFTVDSKGRLSAAANVTISGTSPGGSAGGDLTGTYPNPTLTTSGVSAGTYGSGTAIPVITVDAKGRLTTVTTTPTTPIGTAGGDLTGSYPNPTLTATGVSSGTYGSASQNAIVTVDSKGRITSASQTASIPTNAAGGDLTGNYPNPTLTNTGVTAGSYGDSSHVSSITVDAKGRVDGAVNVPIQITSSAITDFTTAAQAAAVQNSLAASTTIAPSATAVNNGLAIKMTDPMTTLGDTIYGGASGTPTRLAIGSTDQIYGISAGIPAWIDQNFQMKFGGKSDGNLTLSGSLSLSQNAFYDTLTMQAGGAITLNGYSLFCRKLDLSTADANSIRWNGNNGTTSAGSTGGAGGAILTAAVHGFGDAGTTGGNGSTTTGAQAAAPGTTTPSNGGAGGQGSAGGAGISGVNAGGILRAGGAVTNSVIFDYYSTIFMRGASLIEGGAGGAGGGGGGGDGTTAGGGGGGGAGGGGVCAVFALEIVTGVSTPAGVFSTKGGTGGNGFSRVSGTGPGGGGGGGGGGAGYFYIAYAKKTGSAVTNLIQANGGNGGSGGNGFGTGAGGNGGSGGDGGRIRVINVLTNTSTSTIGTSGSAGTAASGLTGGAGGAGGVAQVSL